MSKQLQAIHSTELPDIRVYRSVTGRIICLPDRKLKSGKTVQAPKPEGATYLAVVHDSCLKHARQEAKARFQKEKTGGNYAQYR